MLNCHPVETPFLDIANLLRQLQKLPLTEQTKEIDSAINLIEEAILGKRLHLTEDIAMQPDLAHIWQHLSVRMLTKSADKKKRAEKIINAIEHLSVFFNIFHPKGFSQNRLNPDGIIHAIDNNLPTTLRALHDLGVDINGISANRQTPLVHAISKGDDQMVHLLLSLGANSNLPDGTGLTPVGAAIRYDEPRILNQLVRSGASLNKQCNAMYKTLPLEYALLYRNKDIFEDLCQLGADPKELSSRGLDLLTVAYLIDSDTDTVKMLKTLGLNEKIAKEKLLRLELAHIWGLDGYSEIIDDKGTVHKLELEGLSITYTRNIMLKYLRCFFGSSDCPDIPKGIKKSVYEAFQNSVVESVSVQGRVMDRIKNQKPCVISGGSVDHAVSMLIFRDSFYISNRGKGRYPKAVNAFHMPAHTINETMLSKFTCVYEDISHLYAQIIDLKLTFKGGLDLKDQQVGNCCWASSKASLYTLLCIYLGESLGKVVYKKFTQYARYEAYRTYLEDNEYRSAPLVERVILKMKQKKMPDKLRNGSFKKLKDDVEASCYVQ